VNEIIVDSLSTQYLTFNC